MIGVVTGWAASATAWLEHYGPIAWIFAGFVAAGSVLALAGFAIKIADSYSMSRVRRRLRMAGDIINPMDSHFLNKRIFLNAFIPPAGIPVEGKTFERCEISAL